MGSYLRDLSVFPTLHSFSVAFSIRYPRSSPFFIMLENKHHQMNKQTEWHFLPSTFAFFIQLQIIKQNTLSLHYSTCFSLGLDLPLLINNSPLLLNNKQLPVTFSTFLPLYPSTYPFNKHFISVCVSCHTAGVLSTPHQSTSEKFTCQVWGLVDCEQLCLTCVLDSQEWGFERKYGSLIIKLVQGLLFPLSRENRYTCVTIMKEDWKGKMSTNPTSQEMYYFL